MPDSKPMAFTDYLGFASLTLLLIGAANWGVVALNYALGNEMHTLAELETALATTPNATAYDVYKENPTPDLLALLGASPTVQMFVYWFVFGAGVAYLGLFIYNSIEVRAE